MALDTTIVLDGTPVNIAGVTFRPPLTWSDLGPSGMRAASYIFGPVQGESDSATVTVFYFGAQNGGGIQENMSRWLNQMSVSEDYTPQDLALEQHMTVDGLPVHTIEVAGTYNASVGGPMSGKTTPKENYRMVGVVVEAPEGNVFFKLTGPDRTSDQMISLLVVMISQLKRTAAPASGQ
ncbi:MAG: hypothetical protein SGI97_02305 [candidate division Zixibacteria bacterium]|nr:hypothetical protein [candidate division Zixibacteria bacterium]